MDIEGVHKCNDSRCHCPTHGTPMYYHEKSRSHACQTLECEYARGYEDRLLEKALEWRRQR